MRAVIYCRVSSERQEDNHSLGTQLAGCRKFAAEHGWEVVHEVREVYSAGTLDRPGMGEVRRLAAAGGFDVLLGYAQDRLSRMQSHTAMLVDELTRADIQIWTVLEGEFNTSAIGKMVRNNLAFAAEYDRERRRENGMRGQRARVASGRLLGGHPPLYGYRFADERRDRYEPNPETVPVVRRVYREYLEGKSLRQIALGLTADGIATPKGGPRWSYTTITGILGHPSYKGEGWGWCWRPAKGKRRTIDREGGIRLPEGTVPALVTVETWEAVQAARALHRERNPGYKRSDTQALLRGGIARCGNCNRAMRLNRQRDGSYLYACVGARDISRPCKPNPSIAVHRLDAAAWKSVEEILRQPEVIRAEVERLRRDDPTGEELAAIDAQLADAGRESTNLVRQLARLGEDAAELVAAELDALAGRIRRLEQARAGAVARQAGWRDAEGRLAGIEEWCRRESARIPDMSFEERRAKVEQLGVRAIVYRRGSVYRYVILADIPGGDFLFVAEPGDPIAYSRPPLSRAPGERAGGEGSSNKPPHKPLCRLRLLILRHIL